MRKSDEKTQTVMSAAKGYTDLEINPVSAKRVWTEAEVMRIEIVLLLLSRWHFWWQLDCQFQGELWHHEARRNCGILLK